MKRLLALCLFVLLLAGCGQAVEGGLVIRTADPNIAFFVPVAPAPAAPIDEPEVLPQDCAIKVNWNGTEFIYHLPGQASYDRTLVEPDKDEFFACTEQEAIDAGARPAQR